MPVARIWELGPRGSRVDALESWVLSLSSLKDCGQCQDRRSANSVVPGQAKPTDDDATEIDKEIDQRTPAPIDVEAS